MSDELVPWLRAAIEERLKLAREAAAGTGGHWWRGSTVMYADGGEAPSGHLYTGEPVIDEDDAILGSRFVVVYDEGSPSDAEFDHIAANDPQDTIARCKTELALLDEHRLVIADRGNGAHPVYRVVNENPDTAAVENAGRSCDVDCRACRVHYPCRTIRLIGRGYRHWPGYREAEWKP